VRRYALTGRCPRTLMIPSVAMAPERAGDCRSSTPRVWLVTGYRAGERSQVLALGEALGWGFELKELSYRKSEFRTSLFRGSDLRGIRLNESTPLNPPWPDLVISAGMRNEPVGRWICAQSGGRTRLVHIGRPWARPERFDLLITTPQYRLPERDNILHNTTTLHQVTAQRLAREAERCAPRYAHLPPPYTGVILGGDSGPYTLGPRTAAEIARRASALVQGQGGSLLVTSSARTTPKALAAFERHLSVACDIYRWRAGDSENPYFGILGLSDTLVVTADSISMLSEACATGKPVYMAELGGYGYPMRPGGDAPVDFRLWGLLYSWMMRFGHRRLSRDLRLVHGALIEQGRAVWLGDSFSAPPPVPPQDMERAVQRVRALFGQ
jgi:mitochondrial fission protein ELM1